jgi:hypothetical protein
MNTNDITTEPTWNPEAPDAEDQRFAILFAALVRETKRLGGRLRITSDMAGAMWDGCDQTCPACGAVEEFEWRGAAGDHGQWELLICRECETDIEVSHGYVEDRLCECGQVFSEPDGLFAHHELVTASALEWDGTWDGHDELQEAYRDERAVEATYRSMIGPI